MCSFVPPCYGRFDRILLLPSGRGFAPWKDGASVVCGASTVAEAAARFSVSMPSSTPAFVVEDGLRTGVKATARHLHRRVAGRPFGGLVSG